MVFVSDMADGGRSGPVIVLTGFGPYGLYQNNPSAAVVRRIGSEGLSDIIPNAILHTKEIPVTYAQVEANVSRLWQTCDPDLVIHVGAHPTERTIRIEQQSFGRGYCIFDVEYQVPCNNECPCGTKAADRPQSVLISDLDCTKIAAAVSQFLNSDCLLIEPSHDPGRYLCGYIYFISLSHDTKRSLFVHVPDFDNEVTEELVIKALKLIINECIRQLRTK
uniref:Pyroglutamyl-peptidase 1 n=2 Tax=Ascaris TaxID=6251 RepID=A0A0M3HNI4_ASCLU